VLEESDSFLLNAMRPSLLEERSGFLEAAFVAIGAICAQRSELGGRVAHRDFSSLDDITLDPAE
jgi:hypothetical protein